MIAFIAVIAACEAASAHAQPGLPLRLGGDPEFEVCNAAGVVAGLNPHGDGFLALRAGPGTGHREVGRLVNGDAVFICLTEGEWCGVVVRQGTRNCGVGAIWPQARNYTGPCASGWLHRRFVRSTAG